MPLPQIHTHSYNSESKQQTNSSKLLNVNFLFQKYAQNVSLFTCIGDGKPALKLCLLQSQFVSDLKPEKNEKK